MKWAIDYFSNIFSG